MIIIGQFRTAQRPDREKEREPWSSETEQVVLNLLFILLDVAIDGLLCGATCRLVELWSQVFYSKESYPLPCLPLENCSQCSI